MTMLLFQDGADNGAEALTKLLKDIVRAGAGRVALTEVDVQGRPWLTAHYNVRTTPTILLMKNGEVVDRVVGTPTRALLRNLLDTRTASHTVTAAHCTSPRTLAIAG